MNTDCKIDFPKSDKTMLLRTPIWVRITIFILVAMAINIHITSSIATKILKERINNAAEVVITDQTAFISLQQYFEIRYRANASVTYLLQPKTYVKMYKQCVFATSSSNGTRLINVPTKVVLKEENSFQLDLTKNEYVRIDKNSNYENQNILSQNPGTKVVYAFPIYHFKMHVAEIILLYDTDKHLSKTEIANITSEIQAMSALVH